MHKVTKILFTVVSSFILLTILLPVVLALVLNIEGIQNFIVRKAGQAITESIGTTVSIGRVNIRGYNELVARDVFVQDYHGDTLIYSESVSANISKSALLRRNIVIGDIVLDNARIYLYQPPEGKLNLSTVLKNIPKKEGKEKKNNTVLLRDIYMTNSVFRYHSERIKPGRRVRPKRTEGINFKDMLLADMSLGIHNLEIRGGEISMHLYGLSFTERSGFHVDLLESPKFVIGNGVLDFDDLRIVTPGADLTLPYLYMCGDNWKDFSDFVNKVRFTAAVTGSDLSSGTLYYFAPSLGRYDLTLTGIDLTMRGPLNDFGGRVARVNALGTDIALGYDIEDLLKGRDKIRFNADISRLNTDAAAIGELLGRFSAEAPDSTLSAVLASAGDISLTGTMRGKLSGFDVETTVSTSAGDIALSGTAGIPKGGISYEGELGLDGVQAGKLTGIDMFGVVSMSGTTSLKSAGGDLHIETNSDISELGLNGYVYHRLSVSGRMDNRRINGSVTANDPALRMNLQANVNLDPANAMFDLDMSLPMADLVAMNLNKKDSVSVVSGNIKGTVHGLSLDDMNGDVDITGLEYTTRTDSVKVETITLKGENTPASKYLSMSSPYADAEFRSAMSYKEVFHYLQHVIFDYLPALTADTAGKGSIPTQHDDELQYSTFKLNVKETDDIARIFIPGLSLAKGTTMDVRFNTLSEKFAIDAASDFIEYNDYFVTRLKLNADNYNPADSMRVSFSTEEIFLPGVSIPTIELQARAKDNKVDVSAILSDTSTEVSARLDLSALLGRRDGQLEIRGGFNPSTLIASGEAWDVTSSNIVYSADRIAVSDFSVRNNGQELYVDGVISGSRSDTLHVRLTDLSLGILAGFTQKAGYAPQGYLTGRADLTSLMKQPLIVADIDMTEVGANGFVAPPLKFTSVWDFAGERARLVLTNTVSGENILRGFYTPTDNSYVGEVDIPSLPLALLDPLLSNSVSETEGSASLNITARRDTGKPFSINGGVGLREMATTVGFTRTKYTIAEATLTIKDNVVTMPPTMVTDGENGKAMLEARMDLTNLSNVSYDVRLQPDNILAVNTTEKDSETFYGKVYASGNIALHGDRLGVNVTGTVATGNNSAVYVPVSGSSNVTAADFITYESKRRDADSLDYLTVRKMRYLKAREEAAENDNRADFNINASLTVTPGTVVRIIVDPVRNDALEARGNASLNVSMNLNTNDLSVYGTYDITEGNYLFNFQNIINNKLFVIQPGSSIQFSGDPQDAMLGVEARYSLRTSLAPLDTGTQGETSAPESGTDPSLSMMLRSRVPVDCIIRVSDRLSHPQIDFDVEVQTTDITLQTVANSALDTQDTKTMQFIWLVAFNSFMPQNIDSGTLLGTSLGMDFVSSQINNLLSTLIDDTSFNFSYRPDDGINSDEFDFGFRREFFNNRLIFEYEGNYDTGYDTYNFEHKNTPLSNDISLTALLNESGNVRMKAFIRTIDRYYELQGLYESGLGIYYREDFNSFSEVGTKMRERFANWKRRRQERREMRALKAAARDGDTRQPAAGEAPDKGEAEEKDDELYLHLWPYTLPESKIVDIRHKAEKTVPAPLQAGK